MVQKLFKNLLAVLIIILTVILQIPFINAVERTDDIFSSDVIFQIHETTATGTVVAENVNGNLVWYKQFEPDKDYYVDIAVVRSLGGKYLEVTTGKCQDGSLNGVKFQNMPGQDGGLGVKDLDPTSTLSSIVYYENYDESKYGGTNKEYPLEDGKLIYKIAESKDAQDDAKIRFNLGFKIDPFLYNNASSLSDALTIKIGDYDEETHEVTALDGYTQNVDIDEIKTRVPSTSAISPNGSYVVLDEPCPVDQYVRIGNTGEAKMIYDKLEFDLYIPEGVTFDNIGFNTKFSKTHENYGYLEYSDKLTDSEGKPYYHVTLCEGIKFTSDIYVYFKNTVLSSDYKIGDKVSINFKNIVATLADDEKYTFGNPATMTLTVIDPDSDPTKLIAYDRNVYNDTLDIEDKYNIQLSKCLVQNEGANATPYDKILEVDYNVNNSDAVITAITVPVGSYENPEIIITGLDENKNLVSKVVESPRKYIFKMNSNQDINYGQDSYDYGYLFFASDFGLSDIKSVKATIGKLKSLYNYQTPWATVQYYEYSVCGCYGYFTNESSGIQVVSNYHLYNEIPSYRTKKNGDLFATSTYTSTDKKIMSMTSSSLSIKSWRLNKKGEMEEYPVGTVSTSSANTAPSITPGESVKLSSTLFPYSATFSVNETEDSTTDVIKGTDIGTVEYLADPVFYITLPNDFRLEDLSFTMGKRKTVMSKANFYKENSDSVYSGSDTWVNTNLNYSLENITYLNNTGDGRNLYKITFPKDQEAGIGRYDKEGYMKRITYTVTIGTSKSSATKRYPLSDLMQISGENPYYGAMYNSGMTSTCYTVYDRYSLNDNHDLSGVTNGAYEAGSQWGFSLQKLSDVNSYNFIKATEINNKPVTQDWQTYSETDPNTIVLLGAKSKGKYKLEIQNTDNTHPTQTLQAVVPIPKKGVDIGEAFMDGPMNYSMDFTWDKSKVPDGFTIKYINIEKTSFKDLESSLNYTECEKDEANAILISTASLEPSRVVDFYFDFVIGDDVTPKDINIFKNSIRYFDFAGNIQTRKGSEVAVEVAVGKIHGTAYYDENRNGQYDIGETPLKDISVRVVDGFGKFQYVTTGSDGKYEFNAVRESDITITFNVDESSEYRMNVPVTNLQVDSKKLSASNSYESLFEETLNVPLDKYITLSYNANPPSGKTATGIIPKTAEYYKNQEAKVSSKPDNLQVQSYKFVNWNTMPDGSGTSYEPNETFTIQEDTVLYAQWEKIQLYLTFDYQGGTIPKFNEALLDKTVYDAKKKQRIRDALSEACLEDGLIKIPYEAGDTVRDTLAKFSYGHIDAGDYQINMLFPMSNDNDDNLSKYGLNQNYFNYYCTTKNGYEALYQTKNGTTTYPCYIRNNNGTTSIVYQSSTYTESKTIYVNWTPKSGYSVKYDSDGGTTFDDSKDLNWESGVSKLVKSKVPVKKGYTFSHWEYEGAKIPSSASYGDLAVLDSIESITLKAVYTAKDYKVNYDSMGGSAVPSRTVAFDQDNLNSFTAPSKSGFVFVGWSAEKDSENLITKDTTYSGLVNNDADVSEITLYAVWKEATGYTVLFDTNGGTSVADKTGLAFTEANLTEDTVTVKNGYVFDKWLLDDKTVTDSDTYSSLVDEDASVMNITLVANWIPKSYIIKYTNVETPIADKSAKWEDSTLLPLTDPVKKGYKFTGWTFEGKEVTQSKTVSSLIPNDDAKDNTLIMTANWERIKYTVVYDSDGGTYVSPLVDKTIDATNLIPTNVSKDGYSLEGWYNENNVKVTSTTTIGDVIIDDETTVHLKAKWVPKTNFTVKYNLVGGTTSGGSLTIPDKSVSWTENNLIPAENPVKKGYVFKHWSYGTKIVDNTTSFGYLAGTESNNPITLVAVWEKLESTIEGKIVGASLYIDDKTGVNFYVDFGAEAIDNGNGTYSSSLDELAAASQNMKFVMKDKNGKVQKNTSVSFDSTEVSYMDIGEGVKPYYRFTLWCYSFEMADTIEATLYNGGVVESDKPVTYSVKKYAERMKVNYADDLELNKMLEGMLTYGAYSQKYYNHNTSDLASNDLDLSSVNLDRYKLKANKGISHINNASLSLQMKRGAGFDIKLSLDTDTDDKYGIEKYVENFDEFCFNNLSEAKIESNTLIKVKKNNDFIEVDKNRPYNLLSDFQKKWAILVKYDFIVEDLAVYKWDDYFKITLKDDSGQTYSLEYCLLTYAYLQQNNGDQNLVNLLKSMCLYNMKSADYFYGYE